MNNENMFPLCVIFVTICKICCDLIKFCAESGLILIKYSDVGHSEQTQKKILFFTSQFIYLYVAAHFIHIYNTLSLYGRILILIHADIQMMLSVVCLLTKGDEIKCANGQEYSCMLSYLLLLLLMLLKSVR